MFLQATLYVKDPHLAIHESSQELDIVSIQIGPRYLITANNCYLIQNFKNISKYCTETIF